MAPPPHVFACSEEALAFASFRREDGGLVVEDYRREPLEPGTFQHGLLGGPPRDPKAFAERVEGFVSGLGAGVREASLVVPDAWLRTAFAEMTEVPSNGAAREEVLRWKLKRLVPFRVDELRVRAVEVTPLAGQEEPRRLLLGFGIEGLFGQLERAFAGAGVELGRIANRGLSSLGALGALSPDGAPDGTPGGEPGLRGLVLAAESHYSVVFDRRTPDGEDEPVLHRFKTFSGDLPREARAAAVRRDSRLTRTFLEDHFPANELAGLVLAAPEADAAAWAEWLEEGFGRPPIRVESRVESLAGEGLSTGPAGPEERPPWPELLPLAGAVCQEVGG